MKPTDLRGILKYVPQFRDHIFVIAIDGSVVDHENFANIVTDIAVLRSLNIKVVLVHGIGRQLKQLAADANTPISDAYGGGPTDQATLNLAIQAAADVSGRIIGGLTRNNLKTAATNLIRGTVTGIIRGVDHQFSGKIERADIELIRTLVREDIVPLFGPIIYDRDGQPLRANSDLLASELAVRLKASKLIYLTPHPGLLIDREVVTNIPLSQLESVLTRNAGALDERLRSKAHYAAATLEAGTPRAHILDGRVYGVLLTEIFDRVGLGTMIHADEYQQIRQARRKDAASIHTILRSGSRNESVRERTLKQIEKEIDSYYVYEIDDSIIGCVRRIDYPNEQTVEIGSLYVQPFYQGRSVGRKLAEFVERLAREAKARKLIALSTQSFAFFRNACLFTEGTTDDLPNARREDYVKNGRNSRILIKELEHPAAHDGTGGGA